VYHDFLGLNPSLFEVVNLVSVHEQVHVEFTPMYLYGNGITISLWKLTPLLNTFYKPNMIPLLRTVPYEIEVKEDWTKLDSNPYPSIDMLKVSSIMCQCPRLEITWDWLYPQGSDYPWHPDQEFRQDFEAYISSSLRWNEQDLSLFTGLELDLIHRQSLPGDSPFLVRRDFDWYTGLALRFIVKAGVTWEDLEMRYLDVRGFLEDLGLTVLDQSGQPRSLVKQIRLEMEGEEIVEYSPDTYYYEQFEYWELTQWESQSMYTVFVV
jgi:hypothetical protein